MSKRLSTLFLILCHAALTGGGMASWSAGATSGTRPSRATRPASLPRIGRPICDVSLTTLDGQVVRPAERKGRPLVLACVRPRQELSLRVLTDLQAEYSQLRLKGIDVVAIASPGSSVEYWRKLAGQHEIQIPLALDRSGRLLREIGAKAFPVTVVVDGTGKVSSLIFLHRASFRRNLRLRLREARSPAGAQARERAALAQARHAATWKLRKLVHDGPRQKALEAIARIRREYPDEAAVRMLLGRSLIELDHPAEAAKEFLAVRQIDPASLRARFWLGIAEARSGHDDQAERLLTDTMDYMPDAWRGYGQFGLIQQRRGNLQEAVRLLRSSVAGPGESIWTTGGAWVGTQAPALEVTDATGRPALPPVAPDPDDSPRSTIVLFWMTGDSRSLKCLGQLQEAYDRPGRDKPVIVAVNVDKARFDESDRAAVGRAARTAGVTFAVLLDAGLESFTRYDVAAIPTIVVIDHRGFVAKRMAGAEVSALERSLVASRAMDAPSSRPAGRSAAFRRVLVSERFLAMARHLARQGRFAEAVQSARRAVRGRPDHAAALALLSRLLSATGQGKRAADLLAEATATGTVGAGLATAYGDCLTELGLLDDAKLWYHRALKACPEHTPAHVGLGRVLAAGDAVEKALSEARLAVKLNPHDQRALVLLAHVLESAGRLDRAVKVYQTAYELRWARAEVPRPYRWAY